MKKFYLSVKIKFTIVIAIVVCFLVVCSIIEAYWWFDLTARLGPILATIIVIGLAFMPGIMISSILAGVIMDKPRRRTIVNDELEDITILIAAYNEEAGIYETLKSIAAQDYSKTIHVKAIDNNSKDNTKYEILRGKKDFPNLEIEYLFEPKQGKFAALNNGLAHTKTRFVITIDADTYLYKDAIKLLTNAIIQESKNKRVGAIAGTVLVRNSRTNLLTKMQEWEYFLSITSIKRMQGLFQSLLVAQGAFSIYDTELTKKLGGWKDSIGEDIVLTWEILSQGYKTYYEDCAIAFTNVPTDFKVFKRQRARWARGVVEAFRHFNFKNCKSGYVRYLVFTNTFLFVIDTLMACVFIPGIFMAVFLHDYLIVGPAVLLLFPLTLISYGIMFISEKRRVFKTLGLEIRKNWLGLIAFVLTYSIILSPICVKGYIQEFLRTKRKWK